MMLKNLSTTHRDISKEKKNEKKEKAIHQAGDGRESKKQRNKCGQVRWHVFMPEVLALPKREGMCEPAYLCLNLFVVIDLRISIRKAPI